MSLHDLAVIGAGPAGLSAATAAARAGLSVVLLDAADRPGGQYYRHAASETPFLRLRFDLRQVDYRPGHRVWAVEQGFTVHALAGERDSNPVQIQARALIIAAGAHDRTVPFPGWDLPGVMTAGGAQALLKGNGVPLGRSVVVAGTGPFLLPVATTLAKAGVKVAAVYEANRPSGRWTAPARGRSAPADRSGADRHADADGRGESVLLSGALGGVADRLSGAVRRGRVSSATGSRVLVGGWRKLAEAAGYGAALVRHRIPYRLGYAVVEAHGTDSVEAVSVARLDRGWYPVPGSERVVECDALAVGYGFTPQLELPLQLGCATRLDADGSLVVAVDAAQRTSVPGVYAAGETTGVAGVEAARAEGELAALAVAGEIARKQPAAPPSPGDLRGLLRRRARARGFGRLLHAAFPVREGWASWIRDDTLVCRCEEVPYRDLVAAVELGAMDGRAAKLLSRAGMGWCQGRICGYATACLTADLTGNAPDTTGLSARPIAQPIRLGTLADDNNDDDIEEQI